MARHSIGSINCGLRVGSDFKWSVRPGTAPAYSIGVVPPWFVNRLFTNSSGRDAILEFRIAQS